MQFNSYLCILAVIPAFVICYHLLSKKKLFYRKPVIIAFGVLFYLYVGWEPAAILGISQLINWFFSFGLSKINRFRKTLLAFSVVVNAGILFFFKYFNFTLTILNDLLGQNSNTINLIIPLGISFFTFQQIMYVVSVYRGDIPQVHLWDYLSYTLFFPKLIMGPLMEPKDFIDQLNNAEQAKPDWGNIASGMKLFGFGLFKKMVLADTFAKGVSWGFSHFASATSGDLFLIMLFYSFEIFFDFSGYSDMATGISKMVNITLPINFDSPYKAGSIIEFWKRWHMSLTAFFRKYVYFPLGGSRKGNVRTYGNILLVFILSGLWHGANWTFILWGAIHGVLSIAERILGKRLKNRQGPLRYLYTFITVSLLWLLFRSESVAQWGEMLGKMFSFQNMAISSDLMKTFILPETAFFVDSFDRLGLNSLVNGFPMLIMVIGALLICLIPESSYRNMHRLNAANMLLCVIAFVWAFLCLGSESVFIYTDF